jgi:hypothetical protein
LRDFVTDAAPLGVVPVRIAPVKPAGRMHPEDAMTANVGTIDRALRFIVGAALIAAAALGFIGWWGYIGVVPLLTALVRFCPAYPLLGINTCGVEKKAA